MGASAEVSIPPGKHIVFFDGVCNLCDGVVNFIIDRDINNEFVFESLQSENARVILDAKYPKDISYMLVLTADGELLKKSNAALFISNKLKGHYRYLSYLKIFPRFLRDTVYSIVAKNRYRWFGKREDCRLPTPQDRMRFLEAYQSN